MEDLGRTIASVALAAAAAAVAYWTKDGVSAFGICAIGLMFIWG